MKVLDSALDACEANSIALLNCLVREVSTPEDQTCDDGGGHLEINLARVGIRIRAALARPLGGGLSPRLLPPLQESRGGVWEPLGLHRLADLIAGELELATGQANPEFTAQVADGNTALAAMLARRPAAGAGLSFEASEQALVAGHRYHPAPKARQGEPAAWLDYAPETGARFPLRWLAVRHELAFAEGDTAVLDGLAPALPPGFTALPCHPWQYALLGAALRPLLDRDLLRDLGPVGPVGFATSSVRTVYLPDADVFCKFSLDVRITNCVRKNAWYELSGAVALTALLGPVLAELGRTFDGCVLLPEPGYRTVAAMDRSVYEGLGVILRQGVNGLAGVPVLAGALADPYGCSPAAIVRLLAGATPAELLHWWRRYLRLVLPPVLHAYLRHGVVLEPHLQNVLVALDPGTLLPVQAAFRDLEGTKLVPARWSLAQLPPRVAAGLGYDADRGWNRVVYCLYVNHLAEIAAALADLSPELEPDLWPAVAAATADYQRRHLPEGSARLRALLAGVPLPAKANLVARWSRSADRDAIYIRVANPMRATARC